MQKGKNIGIRKKNLEARREKLKKEKRVKWKIEKNGRIIKERNKGRKFRSKKTKMKERENNGKKQKLEKRKDIGRRK